MRLSRIRQFPTDGSGQEQYEHHGRSDPKGSIQIWIALQHIKEICAWIQGSPTSLDDFVCVDVEELGVELRGPKETFCACVIAGGGTAVVQEGGRVRLDFIAILRIFEV